MTIPCSTIVVTFSESGKCSRQSHLCSFTRGWAKDPTGSLTSGFLLCFCLIFHSQDQTVSTHPNVKNIKSHLLQWEGWQGFRHAGSALPTMLCQFDWSWSRLGDTPLGASVRTLPEKLPEVRRLLWTWQPMPWTASKGDMQPWGRGCCATVRSWVWIPISHIQSDAGVCAPAIPAPS